MRFSLRFVLLIVTAVAPSLALVHFHPLAAVALVFVVLSLGFLWLLPPPPKQRNDDGG